MSGGEPVCECRCEGEKCLRDGKVCGTDGMTYSSEAELFVYACERQLRVKRAYKGQCKSEYIPDCNYGLVRYSVFTECQQRSADGV